MADSLSLGAARAWWWSRQSLGSHAFRGSVVEAVARSGWLRTLGGVDVYLAARARRPGMTRADLDAAVERGDLRVVPAARGCIYLVPGDVVADLMAWNRADWLAAATKDLKKIGKRLEIVEQLAPKVLAALAGGALTTDAIRKAVEVPSFGDAGKKIGIASPLPLALRWLELHGEVDRTLEGGRLDSANYLWRAVRGVAAVASKDPFARVLEMFLGFAGPVTIAQIASWTGHAQRDVKAALARVDAAPIAIDGVEHWLLRRAHPNEAPPPRGIALLAFEDNYLVLHGTLGVVADPRHHAIETNIWGGGGKPEPIGKAAHVLSRMIVVDGLLAGFWEVDPRRNGAVWSTFDPAPRSLANELDAATHDAATFLLRELGHARSYSLDTMDKVQARADKIAKLRAPKAIAAKRASKPKKR